MLFKHEIYADISKPEPILEPFILMTPKASYFYAKQILKRRWKKAEKVLITRTADSWPQPEYVYLYAKNVMKRRWKEAETLLLSMSKNHAYGTHWCNQARDCVVLYAKHVIKGRWKEAEWVISKTSGIGTYLSILKDKEKKEFKNAVMMDAMDGSEAAKRFFAWKPTHIVKMKGSKAFEIMLDNDHYDRWGRHRDGIQRAFSLSQWIEPIPHTHKVLDIEYDEKNNTWYFKRQRNNWDSRDCKQYVLKGSVIPIK